MAVAVPAHQMNGVPKTPSARQPIKKTPTSGPTAAKKALPAVRSPSSAVKPVMRKAASIAGEQPIQNTLSAYSIMANRIANRVAEMAESITFVEKPRAKEPEPTTEEKRRPRKLEMRLDTGSADSVAFSAPFLDNTLQKMLQLQNRMLTTTAQLSKAGTEEKIVKEHAAQSAELSRIIALICAEKARQGV